MCLKTSSKTFHMVPLRLLTLPQMSSPHISARLDFIPHCTHIHAHTCQKKNFVRIWQQRHRIRYNRQCHNGKVKRTVFGWEMHWQWWKWLDSDFKINHHEFSFVDRADVNFIDNEFYTFSFMECFCATLFIFRLTARMCLIGKLLWMCPLLASFSHNEFSTDFA